MDSKAEVLLDGLAFPEGPRWHEGRLWFSDMHDLRVRTLDLSGKSDVVVEVPHAPSGLGWLPDGRLLVVSMEDRRLLRLEPQGLVQHADLSGLATYHCNDMVTDARGRSYVGNFGFDLHARAPQRDAEIVLVLPDGRARVAAAGMKFPNGMVITPDGRTLIAGESSAARLTAFEVEADGSLHGRRTWARFGDKGVAPDGICLDADGAVWMASPVSREVLRVREGGAVTHRLPTGEQATACAVGGGHLYVTTGRVMVTPEQSRAALGGAIWRLPLDTPGGLAAG